MGITYTSVALSDPANFNRVGWFFRDECGPAGIVQPMLFDSDRWGQCEEAVIAEEAGKIVGVVTLAFHGIDGSERPTIDTFYVTPSHRRQGVGGRLFERGARRLLEMLGDIRIFCELQSHRMIGVIDKLPDDLRARLDLRHSYRFGDCEADFWFQHGGQDE